MSRMTKETLVEWYEPNIDRIVLIEGEDQRRAIYRRVWHFLRKCANEQEEEAVRGWVRQCAQRAQSKADLSPGGLFIHLIEKTAPSLATAPTPPRPRPPEIEWPKGRPMLRDLTDRYMRGENIKAYLAENHPCVVHDQPVEAR